MGLLRRFWARSPVEKRALMQAIPFLFAVRVGLLVLPFRTVARAVIKVAPKKSRARPPDAAVRDAVGWAVVHANRAVPGRGACLHEALAAYVLLARSGFEPRLQIGVRRREDGGLAAHAWIEEEGCIVVGGSRSDIAGFVTFKDWEQVANLPRSAW